MNYFTKLSILFATMFLSANLVFAQEAIIPFDDLPPNNEFGKCYAKCKSADVYETVTKRVLVREASTILKKVPAQYENRTERLMVKEGAVTYKVIPATYKTVTERIVVRPEQVKLTTIPAKFANRTREVLVSEERGQWVKKKKYPNCFSENPDDCYIACYEKIPAQYRTETYQVMVDEARTEETVIPAKYKTVTRRVIDTPARTVEVNIDPVYKNFTTKVLVSAEATRTETIPAKYKDVREKRLVSKGTYGKWEEILCDTKTDDRKIREVQRTLRDKGYNPGPIDGVMGRQTKDALAKFQTDNNLPIGNLNLKTLDALGIQY